MKKLLLIVLSIFNIIFFIERSILRDDTVFVNLAQNEGRTIDTVLDIHFEDKDSLEDIINILISFSNETGSSFKFLQERKDQASLTFVVYGSYFNNTSYNKNGLIDFTNKNEEKYFSTEIFDDNAILIPHFNRLPMIRNNTGIKTRFAYTIEPISYLDFDSFVNQNYGEVMQIDSPEDSIISIYIVEGNRGEFINALKINGYESIQSSTSEWVKDNLDSNIEQLYFWTIGTLLIAFMLVYNTLQRKRLFVHRMLGITTIEQYFKIYILPITLTVIASFVPLILYTTILYYPYPELIKDAYTIGSEMFKVPLFCLIVATALVYFENILNQRHQSLAIWSSSILKTLLLLMLFPSLIKQSSTLKQTVEEYNNYDNLTQVFSNSFTLSNEIYMNFIPLVTIDSEEIQQLRLELEAKDAVYFDSNTHSKSIDSYLKKSTGDYKKVMTQAYKEYKDAKSVLYWDTIFVNKNYLLNNQILETVNPNVSTLIVPTHHIEDVKKTYESYPPCKESQCVIIEKNLKVTNLSLWNMDYVKSFENPILFSPSSDLMPITIPNFISGAAPDSNAADIFNRSLYISNEHLASVEKLIENVGEAYTISLDNLIRDLTDNSKVLAFDLLRNMIVYFILIVALIVQSILNYQNIYSKEIAVKIVQGLSYSESIKEILVTNIFVYAIISIMLFTRKVPAFLGVKTNEIFEMSNSSVFILMSGVIALEFIIHLYFRSKFKKNIIIRLKGERNE